MWPRTVDGQLLKRAVPWFGPQCKVWLPGEVEGQTVRRRELVINDSELESNFRHLFWLGAWCSHNDGGSNNHANADAPGRGRVGSINKSSNNTRVTFFLTGRFMPGKILSVSYSFFNPH